MAVPYIIEKGNVMCRLIHGKSSRIRPALRVKDAKARFRRPRHMWNLPCNDVVEFYGEQDRIFPTGLLSRVTARLDKLGFRYTIKESGKVRTPIPQSAIQTDMLFGKSLHAPQLKAARVMLSAERGRLWAATNAGKTVIVSALLRAVAEHTKLLAIIVVPSSSLVYQTSKEMQEMCGSDIKVGIVGDGWRPDDRLEKHVYVCTAQTLSRGVGKWLNQANAKNKYGLLARLIKKANFISIDEGHHSAANTWSSILRECSARFRYAVSGTFKTNDPVRDFTFQAYTGPILYRIRNSDMIKLGLSAEPYVHCLTDHRVFSQDFDELIEKKVGRVRVRDKATGEVTWRRKDVEPSRVVGMERALLATSPVICRAIAQIARASIQARLKPMVFTVLLSQLEAVRTACEAMGLKVVAVSGSVPAALRQMKIKDFVQNDNAVLIATSVFDEGMNMPAIGHMIMASGDLSIVKILQRVGRAIRKKKEGLNAVLVTDISASNGQYVARHTVERIRVYKREGFIVRNEPSLSKYLDKLVAGWKGLLGSERYESKLQKQNEASPKASTEKQASGRRKKRSSISASS